MRDATRVLIVMCSISLALTAWGCDLATGLGVPDSDDYDFNTSCQSDGDTCSSCCEAIGFDTSLMSLGDCGCAYSVRDAVVCEGSNADFDTCWSCCEAAGYTSAGSGSSGCRCMRVQPDPPTGTQTSTGSGSSGGGTTTDSGDGNHDGCTSSGQSCTCSNTGWAGTCDTGPAKSGLYCQCG